jgi:thymidylate synthase (FAD)
MKSTILDNGYLELIETFGDEKTIINAARVSFGVEKTELDEKDMKLMRYLYKNKHFSPFRHLMFRFKIKAPEFVLRQMYKHCIGIETTSNSSCKDHAWNEVSGRYKPVEDYYYPKIWRGQSDSSKQCSDGEIKEQEKASNIFNENMKKLIESYDELLKLGVAKEQARIMLPLNQYTIVVWTASSQAILNFIELRDDPHSQFEIREYALAMKDMLKIKFPKLFNVWFNEPKI